MTFKILQPKNSTSLNKPVIMMNKAQIGYQGMTETESKLDPANLLRDKRIARGCNKSRIMQPMAKNAVSTKVKQRNDGSAQNMQSSLEVPPFPGRESIEIQTELYLEELVDEKANEYNEIETQTDALIERPLTPKYIPFKVGIDQETHIEPNDLFHYENELESIVNLIIGKTIEQSIEEVWQEEETNALKRQQIEYNRRVKEEQIETRRLEEIEKRKFREKETRKAQELKRIQTEIESKRKIQSKILSKTYLLHIHSKIFSQLNDEGYFNDSVKAEVNLEFMPWLHTHVQTFIKKHNKIELLVDNLIMDSINQH